MGEKRGAALSPSRHKILEAMRDDPFVTQVRLVELVGLPKPILKKHQIFEGKRLDPTHRP
jgi:hypothetical protein